MTGKYIAYYRLKNNLTQQALAARIHTSPETIAQYENGSAVPTFSVLKQIAETLDADICDFMAYRNEHLTFVHGAFRNGASLTVMQQEFIHLSVEEYLNRFYIIVEILGEGVLPASPVCHGIRLSLRVEDDAKTLRKAFHFPEEGPVCHLIRTVEDEGILVCFLDIDGGVFTGMNGLVNGRPYIAVNQNMTPERIQTAIVLEMVRLAFAWPNELDSKDAEDRVAAISEAFFYSGRRMEEHVSEAGEASWMEREEPELFSRLVFGAVEEHEITIEKGAELLKQPYLYVASNCFPELAML